MMFLCFRKTSFMVNIKEMYAGYFEVDFIILTEFQRI